MTTTRACVYCPATGADVCVRAVVDSSGHGWHEFAHRGCAERRGVQVLYSVKPAPAMRSAQ